MAGLTERHDIVRAVTRLPGLARSLNAVSRRLVRMVRMSDLDHTVKTPEERDRIVRLFAAGIVAENPQKFGLNDRPFAELYKLAM